MEEKLRIYLADASEAYLRLVRDKLESEGDFEVVGTATDGGAALRELRALAPDLLVADVLLPELDGLGLLRELRTEGMRFPVMFLSAFSNDRAARRASQYGASDYLLKPCCIPHLVRRIREAAHGERRTRDYTPEIGSALRAFGVPPHLNGHEFLAEALTRTVEDRSRLRGVTKVLYPELAQHFATTPECVERAIRGAVEKAWTPENEPRRRRYFGETFANFVRTPTNARFLALMTDFIEAKYVEHLWAPARHWEWL